MTPLVLLAVLTPVVGWLGFLYYAPLIKGGTTDDTDRHDRA